MRVVQVVHCTLQEWSYTDSKQLTQGNWCLQSAKDRIVAAVCEDDKDDDDKGHYPQLWLFEQVSISYSLSRHKI